MIKLSFLAFILDIFCQVPSLKMSMDCNCEFYSGNVCDQIPYCKWNATQCISRGDEHSTFNNCTRKSFQQCKPPFCVKNKGQCEFFEKCEKLPETNGQNESRFFCSLYGCKEQKKESYKYTCTNIDFPNTCSDLTVQISCEQANFKKEKCFWDNTEPPPKCKGFTKCQSLNEQECQLNQMKNFCLFEQNKCREKECKDISIQSICNQYPQCEYKNQTCQTRICENSPFGQCDFRGDLYGYCSYDKSREQCSSCFQYSKVLNYSTIRQQIVKFLNLMISFFIIHFIIQ